MKKTRNAHKKNNRQQKRRTRVNRARKIHDVGRGRLGKLITAAALASAAAEPHSQTVRQRLIASPLGAYVPEPVPVQVPVFKDRATFGNRLASSPFLNTLGRKAAAQTAFWGTLAAATRARDGFNEFFAPAPPLWMDRAVDRGTMKYDYVNGIYYDL